MSETSLMPPRLVRYEVVCSCGLGGNHFTVRVGEPASVSWTCICCHTMNRVTWAAGWTP